MINNRAPLIFVIALSILTLFACGQASDTTCIDELTNSNETRVFDACKIQAEQGNTQAQYRIAGLYMMGKGVKKNEEKASYWASLAAKSGHVKAMVILAGLYPEGSPQAIEWFTKAAEMGDTFSQTELGRLYLKDNAATFDGDKGIYWYSKAAESSNKLSDIKNIAYKYLSGDTTPVNGDMALYWFKKGVIQKDGDSMHSIGQMYLFGQGVLKDYEKAYAWFSLAEKYGDQFSHQYLTTLEKGLDKKVIMSAKNLAVQLESLYL